MPIDLQLGNVDQRSLATDLTPGLKLKVGNPKSFQATASMGQSFIDTQGFVNQQAAKAIVKEQPNASTAVETEQEPRQYATFYFNPRVGLGRTFNKIDFPEVGTQNIGQTQLNIAASVGLNLNSLLYLDGWFLGAGGKFTHTLKNQVDWLDPETKEERSVTAPAYNRLNGFVEFGHHRDEFWFFGLRYSPKSECTAFVQGIDAENGLGAGINLGLKDGRFNIGAEFTWRIFRDNKGFLNLIDLP